MPIVRFLPADIAINVPAGTLIHEAAIRAGIEELHLPCGGKGTCGQCLVEILEGDPETIGHSRLEEALASRGLVMACQTKVRSDLIVKMKETTDAAMRVMGESNMLVSQEYLPDRDHLSPLFRTETLTVPPATIEEHYSDWQRLVRELTRRQEPAPIVRTDLHVLAKLAAVLREHDGHLTVLLQDDEGGVQVLDVQAGPLPIYAYGLAIDIGTTTVATQLISLHNGAVLANRTSYNTQMRRGADVISRIDYARTPEKQAELRSLILETLNELIADMLDHAQVPADAVRTVFVSANTTMIHLWLGLQPRFIRESPYVPTVNAVPLLTAGEVGLNINPQAVVACAPGVGSYVGGDITSGLLCTEIPTNNEEVFLFLDIGTNGEIVLGNADWMVACACSAGPAFEGSGIKCGMRATTGAIEYLQVNPDGQDVKYDVIGDTVPAGVCGSGLICLLGELMLKGIVDQSGRFNTELKSDRLVIMENGPAFVLEWGEKTMDGSNLIITEADIENLLRTKAAIFAACSLILGNIGLDWDAISKVYIAGGFGRYIQIEDAILIGLLPDLPHERFLYIGNSSLTGAYIALLSREHRCRLQEIAGKITYVDLSSDPRYMDSYLAALFLPHTDLHLFPSVEKQLTSLRNK